MSEKQAPYNVKPEERPQRSLLDRALGRYPVQEETEEGLDSAHEHLFRVVLGNDGLVLRWCERCGKAFLLQQATEPVQTPALYQWVEIQEPMTSASSSP